MKKWAIVFTLVFVVGSCSKQSPDSISTDYKDSLSDSLRAESCRNTELTNNLLEARNLKNLFECTKWNKKFPSMYKSILEMNPDSWNYFATPINNKIFNDKQLREKLIDLTNELDSFGGLDELGKVIQSLSDSNFFKNIHDVISCAEGTDTCLTNEKLKRKDLVSFFNLFQFSSEDLSFLESFFKSFSLAIAEAESFPAALRKELDKPLFSSTRLVFLDQIFSKMSSLEFKNDLAFYKNVLSQRVNEEFWLKSFFRNSIRAEDFDDLVFFPIEAEKNLWKDFRLLNIAIKSDLVCNPPGNINVVKIDVSDHMTTFLRELFDSTQENLFQKTIQSIGLIKTATQMCQELQGYRGNIHGYLSKTADLKHEMDFVETLSSSSNLLVNSSFYDFFKKIQLSHPPQGAKELFLIESFSGDFFVSFLEMVKLFNRGKEGPVFTGYELIKNLDNSFYESALKLIEWAESKDQGQLKSVGRIWNALSDEGKLFFINFFDAHYKNGANVSLLTAYYSSTLKVGNQAISEVLNELFSKKEREGEDVFINALSDVTDVLSSDGLLEEFKIFFSKDHILKILKIISSGYVEPEGSASISDIYILEPLEDQALPQVDLSGRLSNASQKCLKEMTEPSVNFYSLINTPPKECSSFVKNDPLMKAFFAMSDFSHFLKDLGGNGLTDRGVLSPVLLNNYASLFKNISEKYKSDTEEGLYPVLKEVNKFFKKSEVRKSVEKVGSGILLLSEDNGLTEVASSYFGQDTNFNEVENIFKSIEIAASLFDGYKKGRLDDFLNEVIFIEDPAYRCKNFNQELGGSACPTSKDMKTIASRIVKRSIRRNDGFPSAIEQIVKMISVDHGLLIPLSAEVQRKKVVSLNESLRMFYGFTDVNISENKKDLKLQIYPEAVRDYFDNPDWEVTKKQAKSGFNDVPRQINTMERIEVVIRDVRFDELYLGAHYMNAVAKSENYNKTVESKFGLLKTCVPLKFCGKLMNKGEQGLAKNSKDTFLALLDVNTVNGWEFGDYMQALLSSLVSSSPKDAQVSSIVKKKILGIEIDIPYLQTKKQLTHHNGKILGLVSMVSGFSNVARLIRDRVGRTNLQFQDFLNSPEFVKVNSNLLKNYDPLRDNDHIIRLVELADKSGFIESFIDYFSEADYQTQRLAENLIFKGINLISYIADGGERYNSLGLSSFLEIAHVVVQNHRSLSKVIVLKDLENLKDMNHFLDIALYEINKPGTPFIKILGEIGRFTTKSGQGLIPFLKSVAQSEKKLITLKDAFVGFKEIFNTLESENSLMPVVNFLKDIRLSSNVSLTGFQKLFQISGAKRVCEKPDDNSSLICRNNEKRNELGRSLSYLTMNKSAHLFGIVDYFGRDNDQDQLAFFLRVFPSLTIN